MYLYRADDLIEIVKLLCEHGADVNAQNFVKNTALQYAALGAHHLSVKFLLKHGANRYTRNSLHQTALDMAKAGPATDLTRIRTIDLLQMCYVIRN